MRMVEAEKKMMQDDIISDDMLMVANSEFFGGRQPEHHHHRTYEIRSQGVGFMQCNHAMCTDEARIVEGTMGDGEIESDNVSINRRLLSIGYTTQLQFVYVHFI